MNKQIARATKLFWPNMAHVTAVRSPSGLNVNSAVLVPAIGCTKSSLILMSSAGRLWVSVMRAYPICLLPAQAKTAPSPAEGPSKVVFALGSSFAQGDHASHLWKSLTCAKTADAGAAIVADRAIRYSEGCRATNAANAATIATTAIRIFRTIEPPLCNAIDARRQRRSSLHDDHPADAEAVGDHAEALGEEGLAERHSHLAAVGERLEHAVGLGFVLGVDGEREALEFRLAVRAAVGCHHVLAADAQARMHDLVVAAGRNHAGRRRLRAFLIAHHHLDLGAQRLLVELDRLLAAAVEEQIRCRHGLSPLWKSLGKVVGGSCDGAMTAFRPLVPVSAPQGRSCASAASTA